MSQQSMSSPIDWRLRLAGAAAAALTVAGGLVPGEAVVGASQDPTSCPSDRIALVNGGFEEPLAATNRWTPFAEKDVPGWETTATDGRIELWNGSFGRVSHADGNQHAELNAYQVSTLFQDVPTIPGTIVDFQVFHRGRAGVDTAEMQFGPPDGPANFTRTMIDGNTAWGRYTGAYTIPAGQTLTRFAFASISAAGGNGAVGNFLDGVQFGTSPCVITDKTVTNLAGTAPAHPGEVLEYAVTAVNQGGNDAAGAVITDSIPANTTYVPGSLTINGVASSDGADDDPAEYDAAGRQVRFRVGAGATGTTGGNLASGQAVTARFRVNVLESADGTTIANTAQTAYKNPISDGAMLSASNDTVIAVVRPAIDVVKSLTGVTDPDNDQVTVGDELSFGITARNAGTEALATVTVSDPRLPRLTCPSTSRLGAPFANGASGLAVGDQVTCTGTMVVAQGDIDAGEATNTVTAAGTSATGIPVSDSDRVTVPTRAAEPALRLTKTGSPAGGLRAGDAMTFTMVATNVGNVTLDGVSVTDPSLGDLTCVPAAPAVLAPGQAMVCSGSRVVTQAEADAGEAKNTAQATGTDPAGHPVTATGSAVTPTAPRAALLTVKKAIAGHDDADHNGSISVGDTLRYEITATNAGNVTQTAVTISDPRLGAMTCTPEQPATLQPGEHLTCTGSTTVTQADVDAGEVANTATATGTPPPGLTTPPAAHTVDAPTEPARPGLSVTKNLVSATDPDQSSSITPGDLLTYRITAANSGNVVLRGVGVSDPLLLVLECDHENPRTLAPGESLTCTGSYLVTPADASARKRTNTATASGTAPGGGTVRGSDTVTVPITAADPQLTVTKAVSANDDANDSGTVDPGDTLTYTIVVANTGNVVLADISLEDSLVPISCAVPPSLTPGASFTCTSPLPVTQVHQDAGTIVNRVVATGRSPNSELIAAFDEAVVATEGRRPDATLDKVVTGVDDGGDGRADVGDVASFRFTLTNTGNVTLAGARIDDDRVAALECGTGQPVALPPGASLTCTGKAPITQADQNAGAMTDHAIANADHPTGSITREDHAVVIPAAARPALTVTKAARDADGNAAGTLGEAVTFTITAENSGNVTLYGVVIVDHLVPRLDCGTSTPATLRPGDALVCRAMMSIRIADVDAASLTNIATATGDDPSGRPVTGVGTALIDTVPSAPSVERSTLFPSAPLGAVVAPSPPAAPGSTGATVGSSGGLLPFTGSDIGFWLRLAVVLTVAGFLVALGTRRKAQR